VSPELTRWIVGLATGVGVWLLAWLVGSILAQRLARLLHKTPTEIDDLLLASIRPRILLWSAILGGTVAVHRLPLPASAQHGLDRAAGALMILSVTLASGRFASDLVRLKASKYPDTVSASTLTQNLVHIAVIALGMLVLAGQLGIAITPILTALGVGSLAVALALQPTLANLFAGIHVTLARKVRVGDFVELDNGVQGFVHDIGWRSTQIRELANNIILVPNSKLAEIIVKNYSLPSGEQSALVQVGVAYGMDLEKVERVTIEVAREVLQEVQGGVAAFDPFIRYHTFGDSSINFSVILRVREFTDRYLVTHEFIKRVHRRYDAEGIEIPFPQRVLHFPDGAVSSNPLDPAKR
jgi:small-conductance mechanosensitive channel